MRGLFLRLLMKTSEEGRDFIKKIEGFSAESYPDPGSKDGSPWSIGYGHTGPEVVPGMKINQTEAGRLLVKDLLKAEAAIEKHVRLPLVQREFDALASFIFNVGVNAFRKSTLLRLLNLGQRIEASSEFQKWRLNDGKVMGGLVKRRAAERYMFLGFSNKESLREGDKAYEIYRQGLQNT